MPYMDRMGIYIYNIYIFHDIYIYIFFFIVGVFS